MREMQVVAGVLEQFREPLPAIGRLDSDLALALQSAEQLEERAGVSPLRRTLENLARLTDSVL